MTFDVILAETFVYRDDSNWLVGFRSSVGLGNVSDLHVRFKSGRRVNCLELPHDLFVQRNDYSELAPESMRLIYGRPWQVLLQRTMSCVREGWVGTTNALRGVQV